jgi:autotransporter-associated beta strand protein
MNRSSLLDRFGLRGKATRRQRDRQVRLALEPLEERRLLTAYDLLASTYVDTKGSSVVRYNDSTQLPAPGGAATGAAAAQTGTAGLGHAAGIAVAPDGSYYVSSDQTGEVLHFSNSGVFENVLGANDTVHAPLQVPGTLAFGPDGNLYVADLGTSAIYQFDTTSSTQQFQNQPGDTLSLPSITTMYGTTQFVPAGFTFAANASHDLIVGDYQTGEVAQFNIAQYDLNGSYTTLVAPDAPGLNNPQYYPIFPIALLELSNGDLLIADSNPGNDPADHHQILEYNPTTQGISQVINLNAPHDVSGDPAQPSSMILDTDGSLLVGVAPDETDDGAIERFSLQTDPISGDLIGTWTGTIASGIGDPSGLALAPSQVSDLLVGNYGDGVLRFSSADQPLSAGDSSPGASNPPATYGVAVAPDGSYYVSSPGTGPVIGPNMNAGQVLHYSNSGAYLNVLDQGDASGPTLYSPGSLTFGPDGDLYVADLGAGTIYQYDTTLSPQHQFVSALTLPSITTANGAIPFVPVGFTFAANATRDLIAGDYDTGEVVQINAAQYNLNGSYTTLIAAGTPDPNYPSDLIFPIAMQELRNGDLLIADSNPGSDTAGHHQILEYNTAMTLVKSIDLTQPTDQPGHPSQPISMLLTSDNSLLVGVSPNEYLPDGAVDEVNLSTGQSTPTAISSIGAAAGISLAPPNVMAVSATDWTNAGAAITALTIVVAGGDLHVNQTGSTTDVVPPQAVAGVGEIQISGPDSAANSLTIDFSGGSPIPADGIFFDGAARAQTNTVNLDDSAGSGAYSLSGSTVSLNGVPAVTMANTQALSLNLGGGSLDLGAATQTIGSVTLVSGSVKDGTLSSGSITAQSGTISANLTGSGGLSKTGAGRVTLSGSNSYQGGTTVTGGTLVVADSGALPSGSSLTVGATVAWAFAPAVAGDPSPAALSAGADVSASAVADAVIAPLQVQSSPSAPAPSVSTSTAAVFVPATMPAAPPRNAASNSIWSSYANGPAVPHVSRTAGAIAWWDSAVPPSNSGWFTAGNDRRIAALDALLTQYGLVQSTEY